MNDLCVEIQKKYEMVVDFIENNKHLIWNYPVEDQENKLNREFAQTNSLLANLTDFSKLGELKNVRCLIHKKFYLILENYLRCQI